MLRSSQAARAALTALAVLGVAFGLIGMHVLGGHAASTDGMSPTAHHGSTAAAPMKQSPTPMSAHQAPVAGDQTAEVYAAHTHDHPCAQPGDQQCVPAPGSAPPSPPAVAALARSDALIALSPRALVSGPQTTIPAPDLALLSISRT